MDRVRAVGPWLKKHGDLRRLFRGRKKPHFSFIIVHYLWIVGATILASILIYGGGRGKLSYTNALLFASGANTQAGLNPVDVNDLNVFQQAIIYVFAILSCPITLHGSVVFLRLYWFEKRFQGWVRDARLRRGTMSKSKVRSQRKEIEAEEGVASPDRSLHRITNDGILLDGKFAPHMSPVTEKSDLTPQDGPSHASSVSEKLADRSGQTSTESSMSIAEIDRAMPPPKPEGTVLPSPSQNQPGITFATTVKRSDGVNDDLEHFTNHRHSNANHIAILERQRNRDDDEVLRIPGPREAERGSVPRRLDRHDQEEEADAGHQSRLREEATERTTREPTITIAEPERRKSKRDDLAQDAAALGGVIDSLRLRKPRMLNRHQQKLHEDRGDADTGTVPASRSRTRDTIKSLWSTDKARDMPYLSYTPTIGRNSNFVGLTLEQREELGGIEYRSLRTLALLLLAYLWGFQLLGLVFLLPYIHHNKHDANIVTQDSISKTWWAFWTSNSAFMDLGFTLTPDSMISFVKSEYVLMIMWFFIIIGNTGFPVMLRFVIWVVAQVVPRGTGIWEELRFLLDHPRRCFTLLFPSGANWWLFGILAVLNLIDLLFFIVLDLHDDPVGALPVHNRFAVGFFQAASTRTAGFSAVNLRDLHPAMPVLYMIMMYISVFPIAISIRRTNVYEERSLGVYHHDKKDDDDEFPDANASAMSYVGTHLRRQLSFDLWFLFLGFFLAAISEGDKLKRGDFSLFDVLFELVSAYGTVGLSMGSLHPTVNASLVSQFNVLGKLVISAMMIRGRHRGLPYGLDRAVLLPSEGRFERETQDARPVLARSDTAATNTGPLASVSQRRGSSTGRGRSLSRDRDRNIITQMLAPGPVIPRRSSRGHHRTMSSTSELRPSFFPEYLDRAKTEPVIEDDDSELGQVPPDTTLRPTRASRSETAPAAP